MNAIEERPGPIVVAGVSNVGEAADVRCLARAVQPRRGVACGVMVDDATLGGEAARSHPRRHPTLVTTQRILDSLPEAMRVVCLRTTFHDVAERLGRLAVYLEGPFAVRLDAGWVEPGALRAFRAAYPAHPVTLRVSGAMWREAAAKGGPEQVCRRLEGYRGLITATCVEVGGQPAVPLQSDRITALAARPFGWPLELGVYGGLNVRRLPRLGPALLLAPHLGWELTSSVRNHADELDPKRLRTFLEASYRLERTLAIGRRAA